MASTDLLPGFEDHDPQYYTRFDAIERQLIDTIRVNAVPDCPLHKSKQLCRCLNAIASLTEKYSDLLISLHFVQEWKQRLLQHDDCFDFEDGKDSWCWAFAKAFAREIFAIKACAPKRSLDEVVEAMLVFWREKVKGWGTVAVARAKEGIVDLSDGDNDDEEGKLEPPRIQVGKQLVLQLFRKGVVAGHESVVFLLPLRDVGEAKDVILGVKPCHQDCVWRLRLTREVWEEILMVLRGGDEGDDTT